MNRNFIELTVTAPMREQKLQSFEFETTKKTHQKSFDKLLFWSLKMKHHQVLSLTWFWIVFILVRT